MPYQPDMIVQVAWIVELTQITNLANVRLLCQFGARHSHCGTSHRPAHQIEFFAFGDTSLEFHPHVQKRFSDLVVVGV
jgi:hypothetical protein